MLVCTNLTYELMDAGDGYDISFPTYPNISGYIDSKANFNRAAVKILCDGLETIRKSKKHIEYEPISDVTGGMIRGAIAVPNWVILKSVLHNILLDFNYSDEDAIKLTGESLEHLHHHCAFLHKTSETKLLNIIKKLGINMGVTTLYHYGKNNV